MTIYWTAINTGNSKLFKSGWTVLPPGRDSAEEIARHVATNHGFRPDLIGFGAGGGQNEFRV